MIIIVSLLWYCLLAAPAIGTPFQGVSMGESCCYLSRNRLQLAFACRVSRIFDHSKELQCPGFPVRHSSCAANVADRYEAQVTSLLGGAQRHC